jgi:hypothetical protein
VRRNDVQIWREGAKKRAPLGDAPKGAGSVRHGGGPWGGSGPAPRTAR